MSRQIAVLLMLVAVLASGGCETIDRSRQAAALDTTLRAYEGAIRWNDFTAADAMRAPQARNDYPAEPGRYDSFRVTSYQVRGHRTNADNTELAQRVEIQYYHEHSMRVRTTTDDQVWRYDANTQHWLLHGPLPNFAP